MAADEDSDKGPDDGGPGGGDAAPGSSDGPAAERRNGPRQRPPVTIDLAAADVRAASSASSSSAAAESSATATPEPAKASGASEARAGGEQRRAGDAPGTAHYFTGAAKAFSSADGFRRDLAAGAVGGVVALIVVLVLQSVSILPVPGRSAARQAIQQAHAAMDATTALDRRLDAVEAMNEAIPGLRADIGALSDKVAALDAIRPAIASRGDVDTVANNLTALGKRIDGLPPAATQADLAALTDRLGKLEAAVAAGGSGDGASPAAVASLTSRLDDAEAEVHALTDRVAAAEAKTVAAVPTADGANAMKAVAVAALRRAAASGEPFAGDVDLVSGLGIGADDIAVLRPLALKGAESRAALATEFPAVADAVLAAANQGSADAGFFRRVLDEVRGLVTIRPIGPVAGSDPAAIVSRMSDDAAKGDLAAALSERGALPQAAQDASADWAAKAADRVALDAVVERIAGSLDAAKAG